MDLRACLKIVEPLSQGVHPITGEILADDNVYQQPAVIRALVGTCQALEDLLVRQERRKSLPINAGQPWLKEQEDQLIADFKSGVPLAKLAKKFERTRGGIQSRLAHHGLAEMPRFSRD